MPIVLTHSQRPLVQNRLLRHLPEAEQSQLLQQAELVQLEFAERLCQLDDDYQHLYFPLSAFVSLIAKLPGHPPLEMGLIGFEGVLGATILLHTRRVPSEAIVQGSGMAWRIPVAVIESAQQPSLQPLLQAYLFRLLRQLSQNAICAHFHQVEARLARWLLMSHDRVQADELYLTHQFLADMLGVRRSSITVAAGDLQSYGIILYNRGRLHILDRQALLARSCSCYQPLQG
ncbi:Crp/Fnr family transcriptional regulator [Rheinheimera texasensis]|uniref:Crp/Fnr family transcriptional regulator n=1 Tax=Rheinheimera texasensis TaxID=306205 RepID=UPI0032B1F642